MAGTHPTASPRSGANPPGVPVETQRYIGVTIFHFETDPRIDDQRIEHSASVGCNAVEISIHWDKVYPTRNSPPEWSVVDSHVQTALRMGLKVALRIQVGRMANLTDGFWTEKETMQAADSSRLNGQGMTQFSFAHQPSLNLVNAFVEECTRRYYYLHEQGRLLFMSVVTSPALESEYSPVQHPTGKSKYVVPFDYSAPMLSAFRQYLQARFTLAGLNLRWGTSFSQWGQVMPPAYQSSDPYSAVTKGRRGQDWYVFRHRILQNFLQGINNSVKSVDPTIRVVNQHGCVWDRISGLRGTFAFKSLGQTADGLKFNDGPDYNHRFSMDLVRSNFRPGAFLINAVDGMFHNSVSIDTYYQQVAQCFEHGATMITLANFGGKDAQPKLASIVARVLADSLLKKPVTQVQTAGTATGYKLSAVLLDYYTPQEKWTTRYNANGKKPVRIELDEDLLRDEPPVINQAPKLTATLTDQEAVAGRPFSYSIGQAFTDPEGGPLAVEVNGLPAGLRWVDSTGVITGTPSQTAVATVTLTARDQVGATAGGSFRLTVNEPDTVVSEPPRPPVRTGDFEGFVDDYQCEGDIWGWLWDRNLPDSTLPVEILDGSTVIGTLMADVTRPDLKAAGKGNGAHGFQFVIPAALKDGNPHTISLRVQHSAYYLNGSPLTLNCPASTAQPAVPGNQPPVAPTLSVRTAFLNQTLSYTLPAFSDPEGQPLLYSVSGSIPGIAYDKTTRTFSGTPSNTGTFTVSLIVSDGVGGYTPSLVTVVVTEAPANQPPVVAQAIENQTAIAGKSFSFTLPAATFTDADGSITKVDLNGSPEGLTWAEETRTLSGIPTAAGSYTLTATATDDQGAGVSTTFTLTVGPAPTEEPQVAGSIPDQTATVGQPFNLVIPGDIFTGPVSSIEVIGLPDGLSHDPATGKISGVPTSPTSTTVTVRASGPSTAAKGSQTTQALAAPTAAATVSFVITISEKPNQAPVVSQAIASQTATVGQDFNWIIPKETFRDDDGSITKVDLSGQPAGLTYTQNTRTLNGTPTAAGSYTLTATATDDQGAGVSTTFTITVQAPAPPVNQPPVVVQAPVSQSATVGQAFSLTILKETFRDEDGLIARIDLSGQPAGLTYNPETRTLSGTPTAAGSYTLTATAIDDQGAGVSTTFTLSVQPAANKAPTVAQTVPSQTATVGQTFSLTIPAATFTDADGSITKVDLSGQPAGLTYNSETRTLSGMPTAAGTFTLTATATDDQGAGVSTTFTLTVQAPAPPVNQPPVVVQAPVSQSATVGLPFSYTLGKAQFSDSDGTIASVDVTGLPAGLTYNKTTGLLSGTATVAGSYSLTAKATDNQGASVTAGFTLKVVENITIQLFKAGTTATARQFITDLNEGTRIPINTLPSSINIFSAVATKVESVKFELTGPRTVTFAENFAPYGLCGDNGGITPLVGTYTLKVTGFKGPNGSSTPLISRTIRFTITAPGGRMAAEQAVPEGLRDAEPDVWKVYPNPFADRVEVTLPSAGPDTEGPAAPYRFSIFSTSGQEWPVGDEAVLVEDRKATLDLRSLRLPSGLYLLQIGRGNHRLRTIKVLKN